MGAIVPTRSRSPGRHRAVKLGMRIDLGAIFPSHVRRKVVQTALSVVVVVAGIGFIMATAPNLFPQVNLEVPRQFTSGDMVEVGGPAADFALPDLRGTTVRLSSHRGRIVVLTFWASWSPLAVEQLSILERLRGKSDGKNVAFLTVNSLEDRSAAAGLARRGHFGLPILLDEDGRVTEEYGLTTLPVTFFVDRQGRVSERVVGPLSLTRISTRVTMLSAVGQGD